MGVSDKQLLERLASGVRIERVLTDNIGDPARSRCTIVLETPFGNIVFSSCSCCQGIDVTEMPYGGVGVDDLQVVG